VHIGSGKMPVDNMDSNVLHLESKLDSSSKFWRTWAPCAVGFCFWDLWIKSPEFHPEPLRLFSIHCRTISRHCIEINPKPLTLIGALPLIFRKVSLDF